MFFYLCFNIINNNLGRVLLQNIDKKEEEKNKIDN